MMIKSIMKSVAVGIAALMTTSMLCLSTVHAQTAKRQIDSAEGMLKQLRQTYPATRFSSIHATPVKGLFAVVMGQTVAYTSDARHFLFGHLFDLQAGRDLTADASYRPMQLAQHNAGLADETIAPINAPINAPKRVSDTNKGLFLPMQWESLVIKTVQGTGKAHLVVLSDPACGYCRQLDSILPTLRDVTIYRLPVNVLGGDARFVESFMCGTNPAEAWQAWMSNGLSPAPATCSPQHQKARRELMAQLKVQAVPALFLARNPLALNELQAGMQSGVWQLGLASADQLNAWLSKE
jgi:thiol:disulfide interchange protein DsbC